MLFVESCVIINYVVRAFVALLSPQKPRKNSLTISETELQTTGQCGVGAQAEAVTSFQSSYVLEEKKHHPIVLPGKNLDCEHKRNLKCVRWSVVHVASL